MTKVKFSGVGVVAMSGSTGTTVTTRNFYGSYQKMRLGAPAVVSPALAAWNGVYQFVHAAYETLTDVERQAWVDSARSPDWKHIDALAQKQELTGFHLFMHLNLTQALGSFTLLSLPPASPVKPPVTGFPSFQAPLNPANIHVLTTPIASGVTFFYFTKPISAGRMSTNQIYAYLFATNAAGGVSIDITATYISRFGTPPTGTKIFIKAMNVDPNTGIRSMATYGSGIVL